jgi:hypothetical protein
MQALIKEIVQDHKLKSHLSQFCTRILLKVFDSISNAFLNFRVKLSYRGDDWQELQIDSY